jgi:molybdate-binding protein
LAIMVAQGNPHRIAAPADLAKPGVRLVRRPQGASAPTLLRHILDAAKIRPAS